MNKTLQSIILLLSSLFLLTAGHRVAIASDSLSINQVNSIKTYIRVWGLLKYYSPSVQSRNWDSVFVTQVNTYADIENPEKLNDKIKHFIINNSPTLSSLPTPIDFDSTLPMNKGFNALFSFPDLSKENQLSIRQLLLQRRNGPGKFAYQDSLIRIPRFSQEPFHTTSLLPTEPYRLLALARYWNIVAFFYPYKYLIDELPWSQALNRLIPKFIQAKDSTDYWYCLSEMIAGIHDSHAGLGQVNGFQPFGNYYVPFWTQFVDHSLLIVEQIKPTTNLEVGDEIIAIDHQPISILSEAQKSSLSASNESFLNNYIPPRILNGKDSLVLLTIKNKGDILVHRYQEEVFKRLIVEKFRQSTIKPFYKIKGHNVGYVNIGMAASKDVKTIMREFRNTNGIIFDLRRYPKMPTCWHYFAPYLSNKTSPFADYYVADFNLLGTFKRTTTLKVGYNKRLKYKGKVIVLIDVGTQSQGEFATMAFKTFPNAVVIGSQTAGTDGDVTKIKLPGGYSTWITGGGVTYPDGKQCQRIGIIPDIKVEVTPTDIKTHNDPYLQKALSLIETKNMD